MIIGDSVAWHYFKPAQKLLKGKAIVRLIPENAKHTGYGLSNLNKWLAQRQWDVIHFNHGLHDLKYVDENGDNINVEKGTQQIPIDQYEKNLEELVAKLQQTRAKLIFATTTPVPDGTQIRVKGDAKRYNLVAEAVMKRHGVVIDDLYSLALPRLKDIQIKQDVHFNKRGRYLLAEQVAASILRVNGYRDRLQ